jgi:hypothetical protein
MKRILIASMSLRVVGGGVHLFSCYIDYRPVSLTPLYYYKLDTLPNARKMLIMPFPFSCLKAKHTKGKVKNNIILQSHIFGTE